VHGPGRRLLRTLVDGVRKLGEYYDARGGWLEETSVWKIAEVGRVALCADSIASAHDQEDGYQRALDNW